MSARRAPGRAIGPRCRSKVFRKYPAHDIFVGPDAKGVRDLLGDAHATEAQISPLHLDDGGDELRGRTFGPGFGAMRRGRKERVVLTIHQRPVKLEQCCRLDEGSKFAIRCGLTNNKEFAHEANGTMTVVPRSALARTRIHSYYEFAPTGH